jgi:hypothetical protein
MRAQRSNPEIVPPSHYFLEEIMPVRIECFDQGEFCPSRTALDLLPARNGTLHRLMQFLPVRQLAAMSGGEAGTRSLPDLYGAVPLRRPAMM